MHFFLCPSIQGSILSVLFEFILLLSSLSIQNFCLSRYFYQSLLRIPNRSVPCQNIYIPLRKGLSSPSPLIDLFPECLNTYTRFHLKISFITCPSGSTIPSFLTILFYRALVQVPHTSSQIPSLCPCYYYHHHYHYHDDVQVTQYVYMFAELDREIH